MAERTYAYVAGGMQDELAEAIEDRKKYSLQRFLKAFNKAQGVQFKSFGHNLNLVRNNKVWSRAEIASLPVASQTGLNVSKKVRDLVKKQSKEI